MTTADLFISGDRESCVWVCFDLWVCMNKQAITLDCSTHKQANASGDENLFSVKKLSSIEIHASSAHCLQCFTSHYSALRLRLLVTLVCIVNHVCAVFFFQNKFSWKSTGIDCVQYNHKKTKFRFSNLVCLFNFPSRHWTVKSDTNMILKVTFPGMKLLTCQINGCSNQCLCIDCIALAAYWFLHKTKDNFLALLLLPSPAAFLSSFCPIVLATDKLVTSPHRLPRWE